MSVTLERRCENCERRLGPSRVDRRFCSTACRVAAHRARLSADEPTSWRCSRVARSERARTLGTLDADPRRVGR